MERECRIISPGPCSLLQDLGRRGGMHMGFCQSGALDEHAFLWANKLVGNQPNTPSIEITLGPFRASFNSNTRIAICGAAHEFFINDRKYKGWQTANIAAGDQLEIPSPATGMRSYLAIEGGFLADKFIESCAMAPREHTGPNQGQAFQKGDTIVYAKSNLAQNRSIKSAPPHFIPDYAQPLIVDVMLAFQHEQFSQDAHCDFFNQEFFVNNDSNRMAYKLDGPSLETPSEALYSEGTPLGSIQIPPDGKPIILMKDRQTVGGYPKIACLSHKATFALSQRRAGQMIHFRKTNHLSCQLELREFYQFFGL